MARADRRPISPSSFASLEHSHQLEHFGSQLDVLAARLRQMNQEFRFAGHDVEAENDALRDVVRYRRDTENIDSAQPVTDGGDLFAEPGPTMTMAIRRARHCWTRSASLVKGATRSS